METVILHPVMHRGSEQILIRFAHLKVLNDKVRRIPLAKWSKTHKAWYLPLSKESYQLICSAVKPLAEVDSIALAQYLYKRKAVKATQVPTSQPLPENKAAPEKPSPLPVPAAPQPSVAYRLSYGNLGQLERAVTHLTLKAYSYSTTRTYRGELLTFFQLLGTHAAEKLTTDQVKRYLLKCIRDGLAENTLHSRINALKFYYEQVLGHDKFFLEIPRPKKTMQLPRILAEEEITRLFNAMSNKKHKAILFTAYSAGLRVSEVVSMKIRDIDSDRMQILIAKAKGKKDRYVSLSPVLLDVLREYIRLSHPRPKVYLFEGIGVPGTIYSARAAQKVFQMAREKAGIKKEVSFHSLRHSFATHVLEKGVDIRYIKDILGHFNIKTTERYLHVRKEQLINIVSPLDDIWKKGGLEW